MLIYYAGDVYKLSRMNQKEEKKEERLMPKL